MKKLILAILLLPTFAFSQAGGWIGNSPVLMASAGGYIPTESDLRLRGSGSSGKDNYFLNVNGEHSFEALIGHIISRRDENLFLGFNYSYGISDNVTYSAPLFFTFGLLNNQGKGHELAMVAGVPSLGFSSYSGFEFLPTLGLEYTWGGERIRLTGEFLASLGVKTRGSPTFGSKDDLLYGFYWNPALKLTYKATEWMSLNIGARSLFKSGKDYTNDVYLGPDFYLTQNLDLFIRGNFEQQYKKENDLGLVTGLKVSF